jgi:uncharacterized protein YxjI
MFNDTHYSLRKKFFKLLGADFEIFDSKGELVLYVHQQGLKLKESITAYTDSNKSQEVFSIKARSIIDFGAVYDVVDSQTGEKIGALKREGLKSMFRDKWLILDKQDVAIGHVEEDSMAMAMLRRLITALVPQNYDGFVGETYVADFKQNFNPFLYKLQIDFSADAGNLLDRRLGIAMSVLLAAIEGKQS